jgi:hypothetical protein
VPGVFFTPGWQAIVEASGAGTLAGVIVTQGFNVWTRRIDAGTRGADRQHEQELRDAGHQHERAMAYQQRVWQAKHDALTGLISACRFVKWQAQLTGAESTDESHRRAVTIRALDQFREKIGDEDGISEVTAYAAESVRAALDRVLHEVNVQRLEHRDNLAILRQVGTQLLAVLRQPVADDSGAELPGAQQLFQQRAGLWSQREQALDAIGGASALDVDSVIALCDRTIHTARKDLEGRYTD